MKVFTYNLRVDAACDGANRFFNERKDFVKREFPKYDADIVGFQEVNASMRLWLIENFPEYDFYGLGREKDLGGESNVVAVKRSNYDLFSLDMMWLSETPFEIGSRYTEDQSRCPRIFVALTLLAKESGKLFRFYNTHLDHVGVVARERGMKQIIDKMRADYEKMPIPIILTGDFNAEPDSKVYSIATESEIGSRKLSDITADVGSTFHAYTPETYGIKIDYIFTTLETSSPAFTAVDTENGVYLSDHYPVGAELIL